MARPLRASRRSPSALAQQFSGEIVSCDSVAVYREFDIGTAKPTREQRALVPHQLLDVVAPEETFTAGDYSRQARASLLKSPSEAGCQSWSEEPGLYLRALLEGLFPGPQRSEELRERLRQRSAERGLELPAHDCCGGLDPAAAANIHANDAPKLIRAIEVCLASRQRMSELWRQGGRDPLRGFRILRHRAESAAGEALRANQSARPGNV